MALFENLARELIATTTPTKSKISPRIKESEAGKAAGVVGRGAQLVSQLTAPFLQKGISDVMTGEFATDPSRRKWARMAGYDTVVQEWEDAQKEAAKYKGKSYHPIQTYNKLWDAAEGNPTKRSLIETQAKEAIAAQKARGREKKANEAFRNTVPRKSELKNLATMAAQRRAPSLGLGKEDILTYKSAEDFIDKYQKKSLPGMNLTSSEGDFNIAYLKDLNNSLKKGSKKQVALLTSTVRLGLEKDQQALNEAFSKLKSNVNEKLKKIKLEINEEEKQRKGELLLFEIANLGNEKGKRIFYLELGADMVSKSFMEARINQDIDEKGNRIIDTAPGFDDKRMILSTGRFVENNFKNNIDNYNEKYSDWYENLFDDTADSLYPEFAGVRFFKRIFGKGVEKPTLSTIKRIVGQKYR